MKDNILCNTQNGGSRLNKNATSLDCNISKSQNTFDRNHFADIHGGNIQSPQVENRTGLPDNLKKGIENLSGYSMDDVKVHFNSDKPAQLHAHAFAQGADIHLASGQEKHLPHEAWHVVQQKQGRVHATTEIMGVAINNDFSLEHDANMMGEKADNDENSLTDELKPSTISSLNSVNSGNNEQVAQRVIRVDGNDYKPEDQKVFENRYDERHQKAMLAAMQDFSHRPRNIGDALADPRTFTLTFQEDDPDFGIFYGADETALVTRVEGGQVREAAELPELIHRPGTGFEQMDISGLIMCIGIVLEAGVGDQVTAASGAHFVTPKALDEGNLNERGANQLTSMIRITRPLGNLTAILCHAAKAENIQPENKGSTSMEAMVALNKIVSYLLSNGVSKVKIHQTGSKISYRLHANGSSQFTG